MHLQVLREKMDVLRLTFYTAPVSVGILLPFFLMTEFRRLVKYGYATEFQGHLLKVICMQLALLAQHGVASQRSVQILC